MKEIAELAAMLALLFVTIIGVGWLNRHGYGCQTITPELTSCPTRENPIE